MDIFFFIFGFVVYHFVFLVFVPFVFVFVFHIRLFVCRFPVLLSKNNNKIYHVTGKSLSTKQKTTATIVYFKTHTQNSSIIL